MKKIFVFLLLQALMFPVLFSQESEPPIKKPKPNAIFVAPLNMFDFINPSIQIGYERMFNKRYAVQVEGAYILNHSLQEWIDALRGIKDCEYTNKGFKVRAEFKYFFSLKKHAGFYCSGELYYLQNKSGVVNDFYRDPNFTGPTQSTAYPDFYYNDKKQISLNAKAGIRIWGGYFSLDIHCGIGIAYRENIHTERDNPNDKFVLGLERFWYKRGNSVVPTFPFNIKFGVRF
jgi:hypothetical protein